MRSTVNHFREEGVGANWTTLPQYFKQHGYLTYASGKLFHPGHPPANDYPTSWSTDESNTFYWGNQAPIGDADGCGTNKKNIQIAPASAAYGSTVACYNTDDAAAMNDADNRTMPQTKQAVEYDHRLATRTIEWINRAHSLNKPFFVGAFHILLFLVLSSA